MSKQTLAKYDYVISYTKRGVTRHEMIVSYVKMQLKLDDCRLLLVMLLREVAIS